MIIYSVTVSIESDVEAEWLEWMRTQHIPDVMSKGYFISHSLNRLLDPAPEPGSATYNIQYHCKTREELKEYYEIESPALQEEHASRYKDKFVAFRAVLEIL